MVSDPSRAQEVSWEARAQAQKHRHRFGRNVSSTAIGISRPQRRPQRRHTRIPHPGPKRVSLDALSSTGPYLNLTRTRSAKNVDGSGLSKEDEKTIIDDRYVWSC